MALEMTPKIEEKSTYQPLEAHEMWRGMVRRVVELVLGSVGRQAQVQRLELLHRRPVVSLVVVVSRRPGVLVGLRGGVEQIVPA